LRGRAVLVEDDGLEAAIFQHVTPVDLDPHADLFLDDLPGGGSVHVEVDDDGARYPVTVDPIYTTETWEITGTVGSGRLGRAVAAIGDVNCDGTPDAPIGADTWPTSHRRARGSPAPCRSGPAA